MALTPEQKALARHRQDFARIAEDEAKGALDTARIVVSLLKDVSGRLLA